MWSEIITARTRTTKKYRDTVNPDKYAIDAHLASVHYQENEDNPEDPWLEVDTNIVAASSPWDYEMVKSHWQLKVKNDGTMAAFKSGHHIGFKLVGFAYLEITTKNYTILKTVNTVTPAVTGNSIRWNNIVDGVNLVLYAQSDKLKEEVEITQSARDWCVANPPSSYGYVNADTYLVMIYECDWSNSGQAELFDETLVDLENWEGDESLYFRNLIKDKLITVLPTDQAYHIDDVSRENALNIRKRLINSATNYLLMGVPVLDLNALPSGTIIFDPTLDEQVAASTDDAHQIITGGTMYLTNPEIKMYASNVGTSRYFGGFRWPDVDIPKDSTIDVAYIEFYFISVANDDMRADMHFEDVAAPATFGSANFNITSRPYTTALTTWIENSVGTGWHGSSYSLVAPLQEVVNSYTTDGVVLIVRTRGDILKLAEVRSWNGNSAQAAKIHIEYTPPCCVGGGGWSQGASRLLI